MTLDKIYIYHFAGLNVFKMDLFEKKLQEELEFWHIQIERAETCRDLKILPRLRDALNLVEFKLERYRAKPPETGEN